MVTDNQKTSWLHFSMNLRFHFLLFSLGFGGSKDIYHFLTSRDRKWLRGRQKVKMVNLYESRDCLLVSQCCRERERDSLWASIISNFYHLLAVSASCRPPLYTETWSDEDVPTFARRIRGHWVLFRIRVSERKSVFIVKWSHLMVETCRCIYIYKKDPRYRLRHSTANTYIIIIIIIIK